MSRIVVTGCGGFIGSHLVDRLLAAGNTVIGVDNFITGDDHNLAAALRHPRFTLVRHDVSQPLFLDGPVAKIYHMASPASPPDYLHFPIQTLKVGALGTHNMLGMAKAKGAQFLLASTSEVYGDPLVSPQPETYWGNVNPVGPRGVYDEAKRFAEALTMAYFREHKIQTQIARIFNTYGPRMRPHDGRAIPNFLSQALAGEPLTIYGDGTQTRSFCYIDDLVEGLIRLMDQGDHHPVNLGNPEEITLLELAHRILRITGSRSPLEHRPLPQDDPKQRRPDIHRAQRLLDWNPRVGLDEGLVRTRDFFRRTGKAVAQAAS